MKSLFTVNEGDYTKTDNGTFYEITSDTLTTNINVTNLNESFDNSNIEVTLQYK